MISLGSDVVSVGYCVDAGTSAAGRAERGGGGGLVVYYVLLLLLHTCV